MLSVIYIAIYDFACNIAGAFIFVLRALRGSYQALQVTMLLVLNRLLVVEF